MKLIREDPTILFTPMTFNDRIDATKENTGGKMRKIFIIKLFFIVNSICLLSVANQSSVTLNQSSEEKNPAHASKLSEDELRKTLKKNMKALEQASVTWDEYKCANLYVCSNDGFGFRLSNSIPSYFDFYAFGLLGTLAGIVFLKYRKIYAPVVLSFAAFLLTNGRSSCDDVCASINRHRGSVKLVEDMLTSTGHVIKTE